MWKTPPPMRRLCRRTQRSCSCAAGQHPRRTEDYGGGTINPDVDVAHPEHCRSGAVSSASAAYNALLCYSVSIVVNSYSMQLLARRVVAVNSAVRYPPAEEAILMQLNLCIVLTDMTPMQLRVCPVAHEGATRRMRVRRSLLASLAMAIQQL